MMSRWCLSPPTTVEGTKFPIEREIGVTRPALPTAVYFHFYTAKILLVPFVAQKSRIRRP
jgi:hypothetical protein